MSINQQNEGEEGGGGNRARNSTALQFILAKSGGENVRC